MKVIEDRQILILEKKKNLVQDITQMVVQWVYVYIMYPFSDEIVDIGLFMFRLQADKCDQHKGEAIGDAIERSMWSKAEYAEWEESSSGSVV